MNIYEIQSLSIIDGKVNELITIEHMDNQSERTLLYGYDCNRNTWHTYIKDGEIKTIKYNYEELPTELLVNSNAHYIPNKRLYPSACDYEFCKLLKLKGVYLPFTGFEEREVKQYYGKII